MSPIEVPGRAGGSSGYPVMLITPPIPCTMMSSAGRSRQGPVCPNPDVDANIRRGLRLSSASGPIPSLSITPGVKFSITTSAWSTSLRNRSRPSSDRRSIEMLRFPRLTDWKYIDSLLTNGPVVRATSPCGGRSTLTTSAPRSQRIIAAYGPASTQVRSRIRIPASGPGGCVLLVMSAPRRRPRWDRKARCR